MEEKLFLEKLKRKDEESFRQFIELYQNLVLNVCYKFVLNRIDAEDIAQEVFVEVFLSINKFKGDSKITTWLYRIAVNKSLDYIKERNRKKRISNLISIFDLIIDNEKSLHINQTPLSILEQYDKKSIIFSAINKLPDNQKTAIILANLEGLSYQEISDILKTTCSAVDSLIQRAKKNLKKYLSNEDL